MLSDKCPQCGAAYPDGDDCANRFNLCLAIEYENPFAYGAVHHLTVVCYMLQHNEYAHASWLQAREMLRQFMQEGIAPSEIWQRNKRQLDSGQRQGSIVKGPRFPNFERITWRRTIASVRLDSPDVYVADVKTWAAGILADTGPWIPKSGTDDPGDNK